MFGRLYRIPERAERIGMLLERFGLWDVRDQHVSTFSRGNAPAARALPRAPARAGARRSSTSRSTRSTTPARRSSTRRSTSCTAPRAVVVATHDPDRVERLATQTARVRMTVSSRDVSALCSRKDLLIELRAKETVPAMLLFVLSALTIFHFAVPAQCEPAGLARPPLDGDRLHRAARPHPRIRARARAGRLRRARARAVRPERDLGGEERSRCSRSSALAELVAIPAFGLFFHGIDGRTLAAIALADIGICAVGTLTGAMAVAGRARELLLPLLFLPLAIPIVAGGVAASVRDEPKYLAFLGLYDVVFVLLVVGRVRVRRRGDLSPRRPSRSTIRP